MIFLTLQTFAVKKKDAHLIGAELGQWLNDKTHGQLSSAEEILCVGNVVSCHPEEARVTVSYMNQWVGR